jgi:hypothetical protein
MNTGKLKVGVVAVVFLALVGVIVWQQSQARKLRAEAAALRRQLQQATTWEQENQRLTEQLRLASARSQAESSELLRLRAQAGTARRLEKESARLKADRNASSAQAAEDPFDRDYGPGAAARATHARQWGYALHNYALNHDGRFPSELAEAAPHLPDALSTEDKAKVTGAAGLYEVVYHGVQSELDTLPEESTIVARERQAWLDPQGRWCKTYCMADGSVVIRPSLKNDFERWEAVRIPKPRER